MRFFDLDGEQTFVSFYSAALMLMAALGALLLGLHSRSGGSPQASYWLLLSVMMTYMSLDETVSLHEYSSASVRRLGLVPEALSWSAWLVIGIPIVVVIGLFFLRFLRMIAPSLAARFVLSGALFIGGAVGVEIIGSLLKHNEASEGLYRIETILEEGGELLGITLFTVTVLGQLRIGVCTPWRELAVTPHCP